MNDPAVAGVTVHLEDGDVFALTKQMIARSGRIAAQVEEFHKQLNELTLKMGRWASQRADTIDEVFLVFRGDHFLFLVVLKAKNHDSELEDALTDLDMGVAQNPDYNLIHLSVLTLPACAEDVIRSFLPHRADLRDASLHAE